MNLVTPSKRAAHYFAHLMTQSANNETNQTPAYLTKEPRDDIQKRLDQERAWHRRLSICASVFSNFEGTLEMYKGNGGR